VFGIESLPAPLSSSLVVGLVLVEAILLYVVYGLFVRAIGPYVRRTIER
jgi:hypothetical protein